MIEHRAGTRPGWFSSTWDSSDEQPLLWNPSLGWQNDSDLHHGLRLSLSNPTFSFSFTSITQNSYNLNSVSVLASQVWASSGSWWWTGKPGVLRPWGHKESDTTERLNWMRVHLTQPSWPQESVWNWHHFGKEKDIMMVRSYPKRGEGKGTLIPVPQSRREKRSGDKKRPSHISLACLFLGVNTFMGKELWKHSEMDGGTKKILERVTYFPTQRLLLLLSRLSRVWLYATPWTAAHQAPPSLGLSRQEHWSGLPFPSPMHESEKWKWSCSVMSDS